MDEAAARAAEIKATEHALATWRRDTAGLAAYRDVLVRGALKTGITKVRIHELTGLSRATIDRIAKGDQ